MEVNDLQCMINEPTRVTTHPQTLLDVISTAGAPESLQKWGGGGNLALSIFQISKSDYTFPRITQKHTKFSNLTGVQYEKLPTTTRIYLAPKDH